MTEKREVVNGIEYIYVKRRNLKKLRLKIKPTGEVEVSLPTYVKYEDAKRFAFANEKWILDRIDSYRPEARSVLRGGKRFIYFGEELPLVKENGKRYSLEIRERKAILRVPEHEDKEKTEQYIRRWFVKEVKRVAAAKLKEWEERSGLKASALKVRYTTSQWGSCSTENAVSVSAYIAEKPLECLDYLIVHELAHTQIRGHGKDFYALVAACYPDWERVRRILKHN